MATQRATTAFVIGLLLTTTIAALIALLPAHSIYWSAFAVGRRSRWQWRCLHCSSRCSP